MVIITEIVAKTESTPAKMTPTLILLLAVCSKVMAIDDVKISLENVEASLENVKISLEDSMVVSTEAEVTSVLEYSGVAGGDEKTWEEFIVLPVESIVEFILICPMLLYTPGNAH